MISAPARPDAVSQDQVLRWNVPVATRACILWRTALATPERSQFRVVRFTPHHAERHHQRISREGRIRHRQAEKAEIVSALSRSRFVTEASNGRMIGP